MTSALSLLSLLLAAAPQDVELVSRANGPSDILPAQCVDASADARFVLVASPASNVLAGQIDPTDSVDLFLVDRAAGTTAIVTHRGDNLTASATDAFMGAVSDDGRTVAFLSREVGLVPGFDPLGFLQAYRFDAATGVVTPLTRSAAQPSVGGNGDTEELSMDGAGRIAAVRSDATDLVPGFVDGGPGPDVFTYVLATGAARLVTSDVANPNRGTAAPPSGSLFVRNVHVSSDGRSVAFETSAPNILPGYLNPGGGTVTGLYLADAATGAVTLVSRSAGTATTSADRGGEFLDMTPDGSRVVFSSGASDLVPGQLGDFPRTLFLFERASGTNRLISHQVGSALVPVNGRTRRARISEDGARIVFSNDVDADRLLLGANDQNSSSDLFVHDVVLGETVALVTHERNQPLVTPQFGALDASWGIDATGTRVAFGHSSQTLLTGFSSPGPGTRTSTFLRDVSTGGLELLSRAAGAPLVGPSEDDAPSFVSADGGTVIRGGGAGNLDSGPVGARGGLYASTPGQAGVPLLTRGGTPSATADAATTIFDGAGRLETISADGRFVLVDSQSSNLLPGAVPRQGGAAYLVDTGTGTVRLVNHRGDGVTPTDLLREIGISADGSTVVFTAAGFGDLVPGLVESGSRLTVFAMDTASGAVEALSSSALDPGTTSNQGSVLPDISADGRHVVYVSHATDLVPGVVDNGVFDDVFLVDRQTGTRTLVTRAAGTNRAADRFSSLPSISPDGATVVYDSEARDLVAGFQDNSPLGGDVFAYDVQTGVTRLVSHVPGSPLAGGSGASSNARIGAGDVVVFESRATDLVPGYVALFPGARNLFRADAALNILPVGEDASTPLVSSNGQSENPVLSADGSAVVFGSSATNLVPGFVNRNGTNADLYHVDLASGAITLLGHASGQPSVGSNSEVLGASLSANGRRVALFGRSTDVVPNQALVGYADRNLFLIDPGAGTTEILARPAGSTESNGPLHGEISGDGRSLLVATPESNLAVDDVNGSPDVFVFDYGLQCVGTGICAGRPNSTGQAATLCMSGSTVAAANLLTAAIGSLPPQSFGLLVASSEFGFVPNPGGSQGDLCIDGSSLGRYNADVFNGGAAGAASIPLDLTQIPSGGGVVAVTAGVSYNWQAWYRDVVGGAQTSNFTEARSVLFR